MRVDDLREVVLKRDEDTTRKGVHWHTNSQGMRDRTYPVEKPTRTFRIALVGDSIGAGWGVDVEQRFESILERVWNSRAREASGWSVEIINCAVPGHSPGQRWCHFSQVGWPMNPDMVIYESNAADVGWDERRLRFLLARGIGWDSPLYRPSPHESGGRQAGKSRRLQARLRPRHWEILAGVYQAMAADCRARGVPIVWVLIPRVGRANDEVDQRALKKTAVAAGFSRVIDVTDAYEGLDPARLIVAKPMTSIPTRSLTSGWRDSLDQAIARLPELSLLWVTGQKPDAQAELMSCVNLADRPARSGGDRSCGSLQAKRRRTTMTAPEMGSVASTRIGILNALALLALGLLPWPADWDKFRDVVDSVRSPELNRAERDGHAGGYYEGLIGGRDSSDLARGDASQRLIGSPYRLGSVQGCRCRSLSRRRVPAIRAQASLDRTLFGKPFVTNDFGMHDGPVSRSEGRWHVSHRRSRIIDRHGLGRYLPGHLHQPARAVAERPRDADGARRHETIRGSQLRRRGLQSHAATGNPARQGPAVPARPGHLLGNDQRRATDGDPPLRAAEEEH